MWICLVVFGVSLGDAQTTEWRCGRDLVSVRDTMPNADITLPAWQLLSGLSIHGVDELVDPVAPDVKMRLADVEFVPEYADAALQWMRSGRQAKLEWRKLSDAPDYLGRYSVEIREQGDLAATGLAPVSWAKRLLSAGLVMALPQSGRDVLSLMSAESNAITKHAGLWADTSADRAYLVSAMPGGGSQQNGLMPSVHDAIGRFVVVEGKLRAVEHQEWRSYLNFGAEWHRDFTIALDDELRSFFVGGAIFENALDDWIGRTVRVRGLVQSRGGPYIELANPDWLCLLTE
ncbi:MULTISPECIES: hypothetical protein [Thalassospira]|uniref:TNase-like domain-containing protein n=1 Tax=Thalassospira aquimaris TaxID=3037796 RepID=A0ABT6G6H5_9PROT|nr:MULTISPECIES: hypothetical protein [Thalassospira]MDG4717619.1 hypothetical protein [Thalassospira sp. FZY0004]